MKHLNLIRLPNYVFEGYFILFGPTLQLPQQYCLGQIDPNDVGNDLSITANIHMPLLIVCSHQGMVVLGQGSNQENLP